MTWPGFSTISNDIVSCLQLFVFASLYWLQQTYYMIS